MADLKAQEAQSEISPNQVEEPMGEHVDKTHRPDVDDDEEFSVPEQRKIIHKVDRRLLILLGLIQAISFIDRANVSNAAVAGFVYSVLCEDDFS